MEPQDQTQTEAAPTVLIVEDQAPLADVYRIRLSQAGYNVFVAKDGREAVSVALKIKPTLILLDLMLPKMSGFDALEALRNHPETAQVQVVVMSALAGKNDRQRGQRLGISRWLVKSQATLEDVIQTIADVLKPRQMAPVPVNPV